LTINTLNTTVTWSGFDLTSGQFGVTYQWLDCNNDSSIIVGATSQTCTVLQNGSYAVELTFGSCVDTSSCDSFFNVGINEVNNASQFILIRQANYLQLK
jgi:hypothetical protein